MTFITQRTSFQSYLSTFFSNPILLDVSYDTIGGCKGGIKYCAITKVSTGVYQVKLKNIFNSEVKSSFATINDGNFDYLMSGVEYIDAKVSFDSPTNLTAANSNIKTQTYFDSANNRYLVYVFNNAALVDVPVNSRLNVQIILKKYYGG